MNLVDDPYGALVGVMSRQKPGAILVVPGDPDASYLIHKLEAGATSSSCACRATDLPTRLRAKSP